MIKAVSLLFALLLLLPVKVSAEVGQIEIREFSLTSVGNNLYKANSRIHIILSEELRNALINGVSLFVNIKFTLGKHNIWWWDTHDPLADISYELKYHSLSKHYIVTNRYTNQYWNFSNLPRALQHVGIVSEYNLPQLPSSAMDGNHYVFTRASVQVKSPNLPLKIQSYLNRIESGGVLWSLP